jgi:hypothetical protein
MLYMPMADFEVEKRYTPLSQAIETGNAAVIELLLAQGAKVDYQYTIVSNSIDYIRSAADTALLYDYRM